jgi:hypothetical protein
MKNTFITILIIITLCSQGLASGDNAGKSAYSFLKIGVGAKSQAMGGAFVGLADDLSSLYVNPAGLTAPVYSIKKVDDFFYEEEETSTITTKPANTNRFIATYINYLLDFQTGYLGYVRSLNEKTALGASIHYQNYGTFTRFEVDGTENGTFGAWDMAFGGSYSKKLSRNLSIGTTGKIILEHIDNYSSDAMALDLGILYRLTDGRTSLGLAITNLGFQLKGMTKSHKDPLPLVVDAGFSHRLKGLPLTFTSDATLPSDNDPYFAIGGQWESFSPFFIRFGWTLAGNDYKTDSDKDNYGGLAGGFGYIYQKYVFDYSYSSYADLGNVHRITISVEF